MCRTFIVVTFESFIYNPTSFTMSFCAIQSEAELRRF